MTFPYDNIHQSLLPTVQYNNMKTTMTNRTVFLPRTTSSPNTTTLQEHSGEKQERNTEVGRMSTTFELECNQLKDTTPISMELHQH